MRLYHNPSCSKSRAALAAVNESSKEVEIFEYKIQPLNQESLQSMIGRYAGDKADLVRTGDKAFVDSDFSAGESMTADQVLEILIALPEVMQRPILDDGVNVRIGRPLENITELL